MIRKTLLTASMTVGLALSISAPAQAWWFGNWSGGCKHHCGGSTSSSGGGTSSSGGATGSSGGSTQVPEPGMLGLMGAGLVGLEIARRKKAKRG